MSVINVNLPTLLDITSNKEPDGSRATVAEILHKKLPSIQDMPWKEGNLVTGDRVTVRNSLGTADFRRLNEGVARSKGSTNQFDEVAALLEAQGAIDRELAILSGNPAQERALNAVAEIEGMGQKFDTTLWYGNAATDPKGFTGFTPRFNTIAGGQVIDALGTGTDNSSIWIVDWGLTGVHGVYPKGTVGGLHHADTTTNRTDFGDGHWTGDYIEDDNGNRFLGYTDHYIWRCGLAIRDRRRVVRIANIDKSLLTKDQSTGADLQDLIMQGLGLIDQVTENTVIYMPRNLMTWGWRQSAYEKRGFFDRMSIPNSKLQELTFNGVRTHRADGLSADEARVV